MVDIRNGVTWNTIVNFHEGDQIEVEGFQSGASTMPFTASDGVAGYTGATIHAELGGAGTGVNASLTFAGIDLATAQQHFAYASGSLPNGSPYLLITYA